MTLQRQDAPLNEKKEELTQLLSTMVSTNKMLETGEVSVNPAALYDSVSTVKDLSDVVGDKEISEKAAVTLSEIGGQVTFGEANSRLIDYYGSLSDLTAASDSLGNLCDAINQNINSKSPFDAVKTFFEDFQNRVSSVADRMKGVLSSIGEALKSGLKELRASLKEKVLPKIIEIVKKISDKIQQYKLKLLEQAFKFASEVAKLAKQNKWNVQSIHVTMPEISLGSMEILGFKIPVPSVTPPKTSITFTPAS
jgi:hypothetical protein